MPEEIIERIEALEKEVKDLQKNEKDRLSLIIKQKDRVSQIHQRVVDLESEDDYETLERVIAVEKGGKQ